jgi:hypothetical protein
MTFALRKTLIAKARDVVRWCTPLTPWVIAPPFFWPSHDYSPSDFAGRWFEPAYVASFVLYGVPKLAAEWAAPLNAAGFGLRISGVFCHQSPKVEMTRSEWQSGGECELGDLLVVHDHVGANGEITSRRAVLVQAKMPHATGYVADNPRQSFLYEHWPLFRITKPKILRTAWYDLTDNSQGARYAQITPDAPKRRYLIKRQSPWALVSCTANISPPLNDDMAAFLVSMLDFDGQASRGRPATVGGQDPWSALVDLLLDKMKLREFTNRQLPRRHHRGPRVVTAFTSGEADDVRFDLVCAGPVPPGGDGTGDETRVPEGGGPGVSTLLIETSVPPD